MSTTANELTIPARERTGPMTRERIIVASRVISVALVVVAVGTLYWQPTTTAEYIFDILMRMHLMFLCSVMAHEASHGNMGRTKAANHWWGRFVLLPATVPYVNFRKTHHAHHSNTNIPGRDPDHFMATPHKWQVPLRALALPHYWVYWLIKNRRMKRSDWGEWAVHYVVLAAAAAPVVYFMGFERLVWGIFPSLLLVSNFLWYLFAIRTHEGFSQGDEIARSHNYYGKSVFWATLGLSMHREHHLYPYLTWFELYDAVEEDPGPWWTRFMFRRHMIPEPRSDA